MTPLTLNVMDEKKKKNIFPVPIYFHYMAKSDQDILQKLAFCVLWKIWRTVTRILFKNSPFVFFGRKKIIADWNDLRVSKWWQKCHFWVNYPFKIICIFTYPPSPSRYSMDLSLDSGPPPVTTLPYTSSFVQFSAKDAFFIFQVH